MSAGVARAAHLLQWSRCLDALQGAADAQEIFRTVDEARRALLGEGLLTVCAYDGECSRLVRLWSSDPRSYPVGGGKHKPDSPWARHVLHRCELFVGEGDEAVAAAFDDHECIRNLGLHSVVNIPLQRQRHCVGTFNVLRPGERWALNDIVTARLLALAVLPAVLTEFPR